jgi:hypothetical protein
MNAGNPGISLAAMGFRGLSVSQVRDEFNPKVRLSWPDRVGFGDPVYTTFDAFLRDNEEALSLAEIQAICDFLLAGKVYSGGGGADERWNLEVAR